MNEEKTVSKYAEDYDGPRRDKPAEKVYTEGNLELQGLSKKEQRRLKRQRLADDMEGMTKKERFAHLIYCFKWQIIGCFIGIVAIAAIGISYYNNSKPMALSYAVVNSPSPFEINTDIISKDYTEFYDINHGHQIVSTLNIVYSEKSYNEHYNTDDISYTSFPTLCYEDYYDVIFSDKDGVLFLSQTSLINPIEDCLGQDILNGFINDNSDLILESKDSNGTSKNYAIDISNTEFAKNLNLGYDDVYICFPGSNTQNITNIRRLINFIFNLNLSI